MKLIKYLQEKIGLNYYLAEIGYSNAYFLNKYLGSGDEEILRKVFSNIEGTASFNKDDYNFFKYLYEFNKILKDKDKIKIVEIDVEQSMENSYDYIKDIIKNKKIVTEELEKLLIILQNLKAYLKIDTPKSKDRDLEIELFDDLNFKIDILIDHINKNEDLYLDLFQEDFFRFEIVVKSLKANCLSKFANETDEYLRIREEQIYENFMLQDKKVDDAIYFGQLTIHHINKIPTKIANIHSDTKTTYADFGSIASKIEKSDKYKGKVESILYCYLDLYGFSYWDINRGMFNTYLESIDDCILFNLGNINSPLAVNLRSLT